MLRLKEQYVLLSNDGPHRNVLKFKSPLVFSKNDAKELLTKLGVVFTELEQAEVNLVAVIYAASQIDIKLIISLRF